MSDAGAGAGSAPQGASGHSTDQGLTVHSDNQQILVRMPDGREFRAAVTHTERGGHHQVVIATEEENRQLLRLCAEAIIVFLNMNFGVPLALLSYFERSMDGALRQVDTHRLGDGKASRGHRADEAQVLARQHPVGMPQVEQQVNLAQESLPPTPALREQALKEHRRAQFHRIKF